MALADDLERIAALASAHGEVTGVLAAEPALARRLYLLAFGEGEERRWAVLDDAGSVVERRDDVRDVASIVAMCELAEDLAQAAGESPRVATPALLDEIGAAAVTAERERGETSSPFSDAIRGAAATIQEFVQDVEQHYVRPLP